MGNTTLRGLSSSPDSIFNEIKYKNFDKVIMVGLKSSGKTTTLTLGNYGKLDREKSSTNEGLEIETSQFIANGTKKKRNQKGIHFTAWGVGGENAKKESLRI